MDWEAVAQAHIHAVAGACLGMGIRYAGTGNAKAAGVLRAHTIAFLEAKRTAPDASGAPRCRMPGPVRTAAVQTTSGRHEQCNECICQVSIALTEMACDGSATPRHSIMSVQIWWRAGAGAGVGQVDKQALESCLGVCALALSVVMAGTGDLETLKILRGANLQGTRSQDVNCPRLHCEFVRHSACLQQRAGTL